MQQNDYDKVLAESLAAHGRSPRTHPGSPKLLPHVLLLEFLDRVPVEV
jgi:hypothetical protein